jgi:hypothetical protein
MANDTLLDRLGDRATRRTVVRTGAKIAYASPLVAASFKFGSHPAAALMSGQCTNVAASCGDGASDCSCAHSSNSGLVCADNNFFCDLEQPDPDAVSCSEDAECVVALGTGWYCNPESAGLCGRICLPLCGAVAGEL